MKSIRLVVKRIVDFLQLLGLDLRQSIKVLRAFPWYLSDSQALKRQMISSGLPFPFDRNYPCLLDKGSAGGSTQGFYFIQDLVVSQRIFANQPKLHVDVGSRIDGFVAHVASFRTIEVLDIRPVETKFPSIQFKRADLMANLDEDLVNYSDSLSCLHALEHFGLGRYGDPIAADGHIKGFENLYKILQPGGKLYLSVPIGPQRIEFNAHRVFSMEYLLGLIADKYKIDLFSYINDQYELFTDVELTDDQIKNSFNCQFGCAIFEMTKLPQ